MGTYVLNAVHVNWDDTNCNYSILVVIIELQTKHIIMNIITNDYFTSDPLLL